MGIKVARDNLSVEIDFSSKDELIVKYKARKAGCQAEVLKVVDDLTPELKEEWRTITAGGDNQSQFSQRRAMAVLDRLELGFGSYLSTGLNQLGDWLIRSREITNFTYDISELSLSYFAQTVAMVTKNPLEQVRTWLREPLEDKALQSYLLEKQTSSDYRCIADDETRFGRRLLWYAMVRATKPKVLIETGVDRDSARFFSVVP